MTGSNEDRIRAALDHAAATLPTCLLCGADADWNGVWVPSGRYYEVFDQPPEPREQMAFGYSLCNDCRNADDKGARVAAELVKRWGHKTQD
jgi:hypothetical protein